MIKCLFCIDVVGTPLKINTVIFLPSGPVPGQAVRIYEKKPDDALDATITRSIYSIEKGFYLVDAEADFTYGAFGGESAEGVIAMLTSDLAGRGACVFRDGARGEEGGPVKVGSYGAVSPHGLVSHEFGSPLLSDEQIKAAFKGGDDG